MSEKWAVHSSSIWAQKANFAGYIVIEGQKIVELTDQRPDALKIIDFKEHAIFPGFVDPHVHVNEPGRTHWEGFASATQAAASGGTTTLFDMPLNCIPVTTSLEALQAKRAILKDKLFVDCAFHGGIVPGNSEQIRPMVAAGISSFKAFMIDSGIPEFPASNEETLREAMPILAEQNVPLLVHAEVELEAPEQRNNKSYQEFLASRPDNWETVAIDKIIKLAKEYGTKVHIVHLSSAQAIDSIRSAQKAGINISAETCPHYLCLEAESIPDGDARFKCCPPIRDSRNQDMLWQALEEGVIQFIASDHSPCTLDLKKIEQEDVKNAWGGISSLQLTFPLIWTAVKKRKIEPRLLLKWLAEAPAQYFGANRHKGAIAEGMDADFCIIDLEKEFTVTQEQLLYKNKFTPYNGQVLSGLILETYLRGTKIFSADTKNIALGNEIHVHR